MTDPSDRLPAGHPSRCLYAGDDRGRLRFPHGITLALTVTTCTRCASRPMVYAAVISGLERHLDPLPLSADGLQAAAATGRWLAVVNPAGPPIAHRLTPGHRWLAGYGRGYRPFLLAEHDHDAGQLPYNPELAGALLPRFINPPLAALGPGMDPPF